MRGAIVRVLTVLVFFVIPALARHDDGQAPRGSGATFGEPELAQAP